MPEEIKGLLRVIVQDQDATRSLVAGLDHDVQQLGKAYRRSRLERAGIVVVLLAVIVLGALFAIDASQRRADLRQQLHDLACLAVKRTPAGVSGTVDDLRNKYDCPPYVAPPAGTKTTPPRQPQATVTATSTHVRPGPVRTVSLPGPTATVTRTATRVITHTVRPAPRTVTVTKTVARCLPVPVRIC